MSFPSKDEKGLNQTSTRTGSKAMLGKLLTDEVEHIIMGFHGCIFNWSEHPDFNSRDSYYRLSTEDQVIYHGVNVDWIFKTQALQ